MSFTYHTYQTKAHFWHIWAFVRGFEPGPNKLFEKRLGLPVVITSHG